MTAHSPLGRSSSVVAMALTAGLALLGGVSLHGTAMVAAVLAGVAGACLGAGAAREWHAGHLEAGHLQAGHLQAGHSPAGPVAWRSAVGVVAVLLVLSGSAVLAGEAAPVVVVCWAAVVGLAWWSRRADARRAAAVQPPRTGRPGGAGSLTGPPRPAARPTSARRDRHPSSRAAGSPPAGGPARRESPLPQRAPLPGAVPARGTDLPHLSMEALGREWLRAGGALEAAVDPAVRAQLAHRRQAALDELEHRDPAGFARWLATGATAEGNPAHYLRGDSSAGSGTG